MKKSLKEHLKEIKERHKVILDSIPKMHREILKYSNTHTKEEVLEKYPEYKEFIELIHFN